MYLSIVAIVAAGCKQKQNAPPAPDVEVLTATPTNLPVFEEWIGTIDGLVNAQIRAQVSGYLLSQNYSEGSEVKKGDLLFQIDPRPFQAALDQAQAKLAQDQAQAEKADLDVKRYTPLAKEQAISQEELIDATQASLGAVAQVKADQALVESAQLNLGFTSITSPIDGLAGLAQAQIGDLVSPSGTVLTTVSTIDPVRVFFQVNEQSYIRFWKNIADAQKQGSGPPLQLILSDGAPYPTMGRIYFVDRAINPTTGTLQIVGLFSNADYLLRPGQYARIRAQTSTRTNAFLLPQRAIAELQGVYHVAVVGEDNKARLKQVKPAEQIGSDWVIESGLDPGDRVVIEGLQKATEGAAVTPKPYTPKAARR